MSFIVGLVGLLCFGMFLLLVAASLALVIKAFRK